MAQDAWLPWVDFLSTSREAVIVVAEGCGDTLLKSSGERDFDQRYAGICVAYIEAYRNT